MNASTEMRVSTPGCAVERPRFWENLLHDIHRRKVVPILGKDLLKIEVDGRSILLERFLAEKLAKKCGRSLADNQDMRHAIAFYKEIHKEDSQLQYLKPLIRDILRDHAPSIPQPLLQLASIEGFTLYVTTTFDDLLHRALVQVNRCREDELKPLAFDRTKGTRLQWDLPGDFELTKQQVPAVYHLFGMDCPDPDGTDREEFAVTEEELLEYLVHAEQPDRQPETLINTLRCSRLLVLGTSYPDWLARFFLRLATANRIFAQRNARQLWVDRLCNMDCELAAFLNDYSIETDICFSEDPVHFIDLLSDKWEKYKEKLAIEGRSVVSITAKQPVKEERRGKIFISYASEDKAAVTTFVKALEAAGLDVWWDQEIEAARKWNEAIEHQIEEACVFVALLSQHTIDPSIAPVESQRPPDRVFRSEWKAAFERNERFFALGTEFIIPVYIDDVDWNSLGIRKFVEEKLQGVKAPHGNPPESLIQRLRELQRAYRRLSQR